MRAEWRKLDGSSKGLMKWTLGEESKRGSKMEKAKVAKILPGRLRRSTRDTL